MYTAHEIVSIAIFFTVVCWVTVCLRVYVRGFLMKTWGLDDSFMVACLFPFSGYLACQFIAAADATGKYRWQVSDKDARIALIAWWAGEILYVLANCFLKLSIGFFYLRIAQKQWHIWMIRLLMAGNVLFGFAYLFIVIFQCAPVSEYWNNHPASPKCFSRAFTLGTTYAIGSVNAMADWTLGLLPFFIVWDLKMPQKTKILVGAILAFAAIGSTGTVVRLFYIPTVMDGEDFFYATTGVALWTTVEVGIGVTAGSLATLRPLFRQMFDQTQLEPRRSRTASSREKRKPGFRRSISPSDLQPTDFTGTTAATLKSYVSKSSKPVYYDDMVLSPMTPPPDAKGPDYYDEVIPMDDKKDSALQEFGGWENDTSPQRGGRRARGESAPDRMGDMSDLEQRLEGPPRVHLRDSFRNSLSMGSILNHGTGRWRLPD